MSTVSYREELWQDPSSGTKLFYRLWQPSSCQALIVFVHGFGEHGGRYQPMAQALAEDGLCVAIPDLPGHGRSDGSRGDIGSVDRCVDVGRSLTDKIFLPASGQTNYVLMGHSFGGLVAIVYALQRPPRLQRLIVQSPLLEAGFPIPRWKRSLAMVLGQWRPTTFLSMKLDATLLSHDPLVVKAYQTDPFVHQWMSARSYRSIIRSRDEALRRAQELQLPTLLLYGTADRIVSVALAQQWYDRLVCQKRGVALTDSNHELHHESVRTEVLRLIREWTLTQ